LLLLNVKPFANSLYCAWQGIQIWLGFGGI